jgi:glycosyltransferase involved in cell wall biosynthesis
MKRQKISAFLIAHNEEENIEQCLRALERQTKKPDEVVLIAHNCSDKTEEIAKQFSWLKIISYHGPAGTAYARAEGFRQVSGDIIVSTDGDTTVPPTWIEDLIQPFDKQELVGVGSLVIYTGTFLSVFGSVTLQFPVWCLNRISGRAEFYGPSFAVRKSAYENMGGLSELFEIKERVGLARWLEDNFIANRIRQEGSVQFFLSPIVYAKTKVSKPRETYERLKADLRDRMIFFDKVAR